MTDRVALVTGASRGLGRAAAVALASRGFRVACGYREDDGAAKETVGLVEEAGGRASAFRADVAEEQEVERLFEEVTSWAGPPLALVASAGVNRDGLAVRFPTAEFERIMRVNVTGAFQCVRSALPAMMRERWGRIVLLSSAIALRGNAGQTAYAASKTALIGMGRALAREYGARGITVNVVCPGLVGTDMTAGLPGRARDRLLAEVPAGRPGTAEETAAAVAFLASEEASYVNGAVLAVDGGLTA